MTVRFIVDEHTAGAVGVRADHAVRARHPEVDRAFALRLLKDGRLAIDGARATLALRARAGSTITVDVAPAKLGPAVLPPGPACTVLWQGVGVVVVDKADGVAMHAGEGVEDEEEDTLSALLLERFAVEGDLPAPSFPGRLDRPTSGLVVACLSRTTETALQAAWTRSGGKGGLKKEYLCIVHGRAPGEGDLEIPLAARRARGRGTGKVEEARTTFVTLAQNRRFSLLRCELHTGRTHQIRRHMKAIGHPIVGDPRYGDVRRDADVRVDGAQGLMLHAWRLSHDGSVGVLPPVLTAPIPERFRALVRGTSIDLDAVSTSATGVGAPSPAGADDDDGAAGAAVRESRGPAATPSGQAMAQTKARTTTRTTARAKATQTTKESPKAHAEPSMQRPPRPARTANTAPARAAGPSRSKTTSPKATPSAASPGRSTRKGRR